MKNKNWLLWLCLFLELEQLILFSDIATFNTVCAMGRWHYIALYCAVFMCGAISVRLYERLKAQKLRPFGFWKSFLVMLPFIILLTYAENIWGGVVRIYALWVCAILSVGIDFYLTRISGASRK